MERTGQRQGRALVVEADSTVAAVIRHYLEIEGYTVTRAAQLVQALALARVNRPEVLVIGAGARATQNGPLLRVLRADPALRSLPIVLVDAGRTELAEIDDDPFAPVHPRQIGARLEALPCAERVREAALVA